MARRTGLLAAFMALMVMTGPRAEAQAPRPFVAPKDRQDWDARRESSRSRLDEALGWDLPERPKAARAETSRRESRPGFGVEQVMIGAVGGVLVLPDGADSSKRVPLVVLVVDEGHPATAIVDEPGFDGRPPAITLSKFGFASLAIASTGVGSSDVHHLRMALDAVLTRPEFDPSRVGVVGFGRSGIVALALMAVDPRISCGVTAVETRDFALLEALFGKALFEQVDRSTFPDLLGALCAPRPLSLLVGEAVPIGPKGPAKALERAAKGTYKVFGREGTGLAMTLFGEFDGHDSVSTRLQWMAGLEQLDKHFRAQGPAPLGHEPDPEPEVDGRFVDLAEHGIAGWSAEMSQRPGTWSWVDGVVACKPGPNEFGWLRLPIEVDDFLLRLEWRVPAQGNGGIFLRARPVAWELPPGDASKPRLQALGLEWPSRTGLELQAQADPGDANRYGSGSLYRHAAPAANPTRPPGQWNRYTVRARGPRVEVWSNGQQVLDTSLDRYPETLPNPPLKGYIGLQNHGSPAEYRGIKLLRLEH